MKSSTGRRRAIHLPSPDAYFYLGQWISPVLEHSVWLSRYPRHLLQRARLQTNTFGILITNSRFYLRRDALCGEIENTVYREFTTKMSSPTARRIFSLATTYDRLGARLAQSPAYGTTARGRIEQAMRFRCEAVLPWTAVFSVGTAMEKIIGKENEKFEFSLGEIIALYPKSPTLSMIDGKNLWQYRQLLRQRGISGTLTWRVLSQQAPDIARRFARYQRATEYIGTHHFWGTPRMMPDLLRAIQKAKQPALPHPPKTLRPLPRQFQNAVRIAGESTYWRLQMAERVAQVVYGARKAMTIFAAQHGMTYDDLLHFTYEEIFDAVRGVRPLDRSLVQQRSGPTTLSIFGDDNRVTVLTGAAHTAIEQKFFTHFALKPEQKKINLLRGQVGCRGRARGRVAILLAPHELHKVKTGMILVSPETTPDFLPAMKKAAAFVTDQGGITSHAAIIARELDKPCVVGTKIATQVLKDGDMVEVDAEKGIVKKL